jgi:hypothetical protein
MLLLALTLVALVRAGCLSTGMSPVTLSPASSAFATTLAVETWFKPLVVLSATHALFTLQTSSRQLRAVLKAPNGTIEVSNASGAVLLTTPIGIASRFQWQHVVLQFDIGASRATLVVNGNTGPFGVAAPFSEGSEPFGAVTVTAGPNILFDYLRLWPTFTVGEAADVFLRNSAKTNGAPVLAFDFDSPGPSIVNLCAARAVYAVRANAAAPTIDGFANECDWLAAPVDQYGGAYWAGDTRVFFSLQLLYNDENLFMFVRAVDLTSSDSSTMTSASDSLQFYIQDGTNRLVSQHNHQRIGIGQSSAPLPNTEVRGSRQTDGWQLEARLSWSSVNGSPYSSNRRTMPALFCGNNPPNQFDGAAARFANNSFVDSIQAWSTLFLLTATSASGCTPATTTTTTTTTAAATTTTTTTTTPTPTPKTPSTTTKATASQTIVTPVPPATPQATDRTALTSEVAANATSASGSNSTTDVVRADDSGASDEVALVAGIVGGICFLAAVILVIVLFFWRKHSAQQAREIETIKEEFFSSPTPGDISMRQPSQYQRIDEVTLTSLGSGTNVTYADLPARSQINYDTFQSTTAGYTHLPTTTSSPPSPYFEPIRASGT